MIDAKRRPCPGRILAALVLMLTTALPIRAAAPAEADRATVIGQPISLVVQPASIRLSGPRAMQQIVVTGRYGDGSERDLTPFCTLNAEVAGIVTIGPGGFVQPEKDGQTMLVVQAGPCTTRVPVVVTDFARPQPVSFRNDFVAALNVAGCNAGACHGIPSGRGGFRLSLRGHDPAADYLELTRDVLGRRTNRLDAGASLILQKGLGQVAHEGGPRLVSANPVPARTMRAWLSEGMPDDPANLPALQRIEILPGSRVLTAPACRQQLAVLAHFADGSVRDVTRLTVFSSSDDGLARVDANGLVELRQAGEAAILCRYLHVIQCVHLTYLEPKPGFVWSNPAEHNYVDRHAFAKLRLLNILPSELCTDQEFLRRAYLDLCGILPAPEEVQTFLADNTPGKRARLIDRLLERPEFADFWASKWLDLLRCNRLNIQIKGSHVYRQWLRRHVEHNTPWSQVVRELLTASGSTFANPPANFYRGNYSNGGAPTIRDPQALAETTAQLCFGIRLQCAQCHNHPYERWTQDDYHHMAAWFAQVKFKADALEPGSPRPYAWQLREDAIVIYSARTGEVTQPRTGKRMAPKIMGMPAPVIPADRDRRQALADLVTAPDNPFFARATVNRIWHHLTGKGIVDPPDDFRDSNPAANDTLLDALARDFVDHNFDVKHLIRTVANSRTYQLSSHSNPSNREDDKYFSHALVKHKRLPAEVLLDAICAATDVPEKFTGFPTGTRAVQLPDGQVHYTGGQYATWDRHPFLKAFGQPAREIACECEREGELSLTRVLELKNGTLVKTKMQTPENRIGKLLARKLPDADILQELFLATLSRPPMPDEAKAALAVVEKSTDKRAAWEAVHWALLNTNEFLFRH
jgi:hypothetical protein